MTHSELSLSLLLDGIAEVRVDADRPVAGLCLDSREARAGDCFIALEGTQTHGANYIANAIAQGASCALVDASVAILDAAVPVIPVADLNARAGIIASRFFGEPSRALDIVAVTGTNGKTTVAHVCAEALTRLGGACGYIGTLGIGTLNALAPATHTTPDCISLQRSLARLRADGCMAVALEASSHALAQQRLAGTAVDVAVFTNLDHDHLDYHGTHAAYAAAKKSLFRHPKLECAVVNVDDATGAELAAELTDIGGLWTFSRTGRASSRHARHVSVRDCTLAADGTTLDLDVDGEPVRFHSALIGAFNIDNLLAAFAALRAMGHATPAIGAALAHGAGVPGRLERVAGDDRAPAVIIDYAHTPDALARALAALRPHTRGRLVCVFGCGGDRDRSKRGPMGRAAEDGADRVIVTSDNARGERVEDIAEDILRGMRRAHAASVIHDRGTAIRTAIESAGAGDTVVIAGKGHEAYQESNGERVPFSDRAVASAALAARR